MLADEITADLRAIRDRALSLAQSRGRAVRLPLLSPKGIHYGFITAFPNGALDTSEMRGVNADLRLRPFFAQGKTISIREFAVGALNAEMGLQAVDLDLIEAPPAGPSEIPVSLVDHLEFHLLNYFKPALYEQTRTTREGRKVFERVGCAECHIPDLQIEHDRRVADVETVYDPARGIFNNLFATAAGLFSTQEDGSGHPALKRPLGQPFLVQNIFTDFKRHDLGPAFHERNYDVTVQKEFMTEALWGVGTTAPYGHDGRSINLTEVILRHGGEAQESRDAFARLSGPLRASVLEFLQSLVLFPPDDTASNLNPGNPAAPGFPQNGHGSIALTVLFNDPADAE